MTYPKIGGGVGVGGGGEIWFEWQEVAGISKTVARFSRQPLWEKNWVVRMKA